MSTDAGFQDEAANALEASNSETQVEETTPTEQPANQETDTAINPAWQDLLNDIPEGFRDMVTPHLKKWDQGVNERFQQRAEELRQYREQVERFKPYEPVIGNTPPEQLQAARVILEQLTANPEAFWKKIGEHYGFTPEQAQQAFQNAQQDDLDDDLTQQEYADPRIDQLAQQQANIQGYIEQQYQQQIMAEANQQVEDELTALDQQFNLSPIDRREVLQRAIIMQQQNPNVTLMDAYKQWDTVKRQMFENSQRTAAPNVVTAGGGANPVTPAKKPEEMSDDEFRADILQQIKNL